MVTVQKQLELPEIKSFDLYQHMKINIKEYEKNCKDETPVNYSKLSFYCITCKVSICDQCNFLQHKSHTLVKKMNFNMEKQTVGNIFSEIESDLDKNLIFTNPAGMKEDLVLMVEKSIMDLHKKIDELKELKLLEIENFLGSNTNDLGGLRKNITDVKTNICDYFEKNQEFLNYKNYNEDEENTIFLMNFDMLNICYQKNKDIKQTLTKISDDFQTYKKIISGKCITVNDLMDKLIQEEKAGKSTTSQPFLNLKDMDNSNIKANFEKLKSNEIYKEIKQRTYRYSEHIENFKKTAYETISKTGSLRDLEKIVNLFDRKNDKLNKLMNGNNVNDRDEENYGSGLMSPIKKMQQKKREKELQKKHLQENNLSGFYIARKKKKEEEGDSDQEQSTNSRGVINTPTFKQSKFHSSEQMKYGHSNKPIKLDMSPYMNYAGSTGKNSMKHSVGYMTPKTEEITNNKSSANKTMESMTSPISNNEIKKAQELQYVTSIKSKNDIKLNNSIIKRYFSYSTLDTINKFFRIKQANNGTSSAYLMIKPEQVEWEEENDYAKVVEGTNEIHVYDRKKRILTKKKINLDRHQHGCTVFLDGCRSVLLNDKLFITGGRDENQEYPICLSFDIKEFSLKRVSDMKVARSYHTIQYNENFKALFIAGGQNNKSCEMFDLFTNRWQILPELNVPRANISIYFDKNHSLIYSLFGMKGEITKTELSDAIEVLDLNDIKAGWIKVEYNNKSEMDLKQFFCEAFPLTNDKILIYGGNINRNYHRAFAVFLLDKFEIAKVDKKMMEEIRVQARKSEKLSKILTVNGSQK
jgi:hypothetical protein